jgi:DNA invertase Pin-like site-specific DNA recombinase
MWSLKIKGATLMAIERSIDTNTAAGKAFPDLLLVFSEFQSNVQRERQLDGFAKAGGYGTRSAAIRKLKAQGFGPSEIADKLGICTGSVHEALGRKPRGRGKRGEDTQDLARPAAMRANSR